MYSFSADNAKYITTDENYIFVKKLVLPDHLSQQIDQINYNLYSWHVSGVKPGYDFHNGFNKISDVYNSDTGQHVNDLHKEIYGLLIQEFLKIDADAKSIFPIRGIINWTHTRSNMRPAESHCDSTVIGHWSFLLHFKGSSGKTVFLSDNFKRQVIKTIEFEPMNLIIFPSIYSHQGFLPVDNLDRFSVNYIVSIDTKMNQELLSKSPLIIQKLAAAESKEQGGSK
jgi:hypothetical protein